MHELSRKTDTAAADVLRKKGYAELTRGEPFPPVRR